MASSVWANLDVNEGTVSGATTITLDRYSRRLTITNDSATKNLQFKFNSSEDYATLKPTETVTMTVRTNEVYLNGSSVAYRIWGLG